jgi:Protein of unknown function (DUF2911)
MHKLIATAALVASLIGIGAAQTDTNTTPTASCSFQDGKLITVRYSSEASTGKDLPAGKAWTPGGQPMLLFTQAALSANNTDIPVGAYSMYIVRDRDNWTLVLNKNVSAGSKYDKHQDLLRIGMLMGQLSDPQKRFTVLFGHAECDGLLSLLQSRPA